MKAHIGIDAKSGLTHSLEPCRGVNGIDPDQSRPMAIQSPSSPPCLPTPTKSRAMGILCPISAIC
jgi:hypothetical protein